MKKYFLSLLISIPFLSGAQLQVRDTTINGRPFKIYPFKIEKEYTTRIFNGIASFNNLLKDFPMVPSLTDPLPDGNYIILNKEESSYYYGEGHFSAPYGNENNKESKPYIYAKCIIKGGVKSGLCTFFNRKSKAIATGNYLNDIKQGEWQYINPKQTFIVNYIDGVLQGSIIIKAGSSVICKANLKNETLFGNYCEYYNSGQIKVITKIAERFGSRQKEYLIRAEQAYDSIYTEYWKNGQLCYTQLCEDGYFQNYCISYDKNGKVNFERKLIGPKDGEYLFKITNYYRNSDKIDYINILTTTRYSTPNTSSLYWVTYNKNGDTIEIANAKQRELEGFPIKYDTTLLINRVFKNHKVESETFSHLYYSYYSGVYGEPFKNTYYPSGKPQMVTRINYNKQTEDFLLVKSLFDTSGNFEVKNYSTYHLNIATTDVKGENRDTTFEMVPGSDTISFLMNGEPYTQTIHFPQSYNEYDKVKFRKKLRNMFRKKVYRYEQFYDKQFAWKEGDFMIVTMPRKQYFKQYKIKPIYTWDATDTITLLLPIKHMDELKINYVLNSFNVIDGKLSGPFEVESWTKFNYIKGIKNGPSESYGNKGYYKNGLRNGQFIEFGNPQEGEMASSGSSTPSFYLTRIKHYYNDTLNGPYIEYDYTTGQPNLSANYKMGKMNGSYIKINPINNDTLLRANFYDGIMNGKIEFFSYKAAEDMMQTSYLSQYGLPSFENKMQLIKNYEFNLSHGKYEGRQLIYGKSGYPLHEVLLDSEANIEQSLNRTEYLEGEFSGSAYSIERADGYHKYFYKTGIVAEHGLMNDQKKFGVWKSYQEDGKLYKICNYKNEFASDTFPGLGDVWSRASITTYHRNGRLYEKGYVLDVDTKYDCNQERDIDDETVLYTEIYDSTGKSLLTMGTGDINIIYTNGLRKAKGKQLNGFREGFWLFFDPNGNPIVAGNYKHGERDGRWLAGDLRGFHFIDNQCFSDDIDAELMKLKSESNLEIEEHFYKEGLLISSNSVKVGKK